MATKTETINQTGTNSSVRTPEQKLKANPQQAKSMCTHTNSHTPGRQTAMKKYTVYITWYRLTLSQEAL